METCEVFIKGKQCQSPFPKSERRSQEPLKIVHTDICGPLRTKSIGGKAYFAVSVDGVWWCQIEFLVKKSDVFEAFKRFKACADNLTGKRISTYNQTTVLNM